MLGLLMIAILTVAVHSIWSPLKQIEPILESGDPLWEGWKATQRRVYASAAQESVRHAVFRQNAVIANDHNSRTDTTFKMTLNKFADMTYEELTVKRLGLIIPADEAAKIRSVAKQPNGANTKLTSKSTPVILSASAPAPSFDWRDYGAVTEVKDQGDCAACWSFSATGALEGRLKVKTGKLISLSEKNLIDCTSSYSNSGCAGGSYNNAFKYAAAVAGINTDVEYPYEPVDGTCRFNNTPAAKHASVGSPVYYGSKSGNESILYTALQYCPVSIGMEVTDAFAAYSSGVFQDSTCAYNLNHAMLLVGWGSDNTTDPATPYWIVKNSWGPEWGENGYIRVLRSQNGQNINMCGIASYISYPNVNATVA